MNILQVIHGYPPDYMAGSEVYTYNLSKELAKRNQVTVFCRVENKDQPRYEIKHSIEDKVSIYRINNPFIYKGFSSRFIDPKIDKIFETILKKVKPDIIHIGHLSHLSTSIVEIIKNHKIPIIFTLHDFWLICPRGQLIRKDLNICYSHNSSDCVNCFKKELEHKGTKIINERKKKMKKIFEIVDLFIAPSKFLMNLYIDAGVPRNKIIYSDYGFNKDLFNGFKRKSSTNIRFGYIGTHIPTKGVDVLIKAFNRIKNESADLYIFGHRHKNTDRLKKLVKNYNIFFKGGYNNDNVAKILSKIDVIVVPSIWYENSPLVIHEAYLSNAPVIASNIGGMAEYVKHKKNGLLFELGNSIDLLDKMQFLIDNPNQIEILGKSGLKIKSIEEDSRFIEDQYNKLIG